MGCQWEPINLTVIGNYNMVFFLTLGFKKEIQKGKIHLSYEVTSRTREDVSSEVIMVTITF